MEIVKIIKSKVKPYHNEIIARSETEYRLGTVFKNLHDYYFEVGVIELENSEFTYHLFSIGYYKLLKKAILKEFNFDLIEVINEDEKTKILNENCYC